MPRRAKLPEGPIRYAVAYWFNPRLIRVLSLEWGFQLWTLAASRKPGWTCTKCQAPVQMRDEFWRPLNTQANSRHRLCTTCVGPAPVGAQNGVRVVGPAECVKPV